ncbi:MAG: hypothetical protein LBV68_06995, partial [Spirochaetaceae bacterium]|nr:hypothetical protein [Spirochaetaceae bacterium]
MQNKAKYLFFALAAFIMLQACDLDPLVDYKEGLPSTQDGTDSGTDSTDGTDTQTAPFALPHSLAVINLPANTVAAAFADLSIGDVGTCKNYSAITMTYENGKATAQIPLTDSAGAPLAKSGPFFLSIKINVDDLTKITISKNDRYQIDLVNGSAFFDATKLPQPEIPSPPVVSYLTVINLPQNTLLTDFSDVAIGDAGTCKNYTAITMTYEDGKAKAMIPLSGSDGNHFSKTGVFFLSIKINIDDYTKIIIAKKDQYEIPFINGNGLFDASRLPQPPPLSYLTVINLPANTIASDFSGLSIGDAGTCSDFSAIKVSYADNKATALIPLSDTEGNHFSKTGVFFLSITINIDDHTKIVIAKKDRYEIIFTAGNGLFNASILPQPPPPTEYSAFLTVKNLPDNIIASSFSNVKIGTMATCPDYALISVVNRTALIPLSLTGGGEFKSSGFFYIELTARVDSIAYLQISFANDVIVFFENGNGTLDLNDMFGSNNPGYKEEYVSIGVPIGSLLYQYSGNIPVTSLTLPRGVYCFEIVGAGGGGSGWSRTVQIESKIFSTDPVGAAYPGGDSFDAHPGGAGGKIIELKAFYKPTTIQVCTGAGGGAGSTTQT